MNEDTVKSLARVITKVMHDECDFEPSGDFQADCERWDLQGGATSVDRLSKALARQVIEKMRVDKERMKEMIKQELTFPILNPYCRGCGVILNCLSILADKKEEIITWD